MILELARESDWEDVRILSVQIHDLHVSWRPDIFEHTNEPYPKERFLEDIENGLVYVRRIQGVVAAYVTLTVMHKAGPGLAAHKLLRLDSVCVEESHRGQGIGKAMMADVIEIAKNMGCSDLLLGVHPENEKAVAFYQKCGFSVRTVNMQREV